MRVGIVGVGGMGGVHANKYAQMSDIELVAFDTDSAKLDAFCQARRAKRATSWEDLLNASDAIDICLPTTLHADFATRSLAAGKPTLVEKPLARTVAECERMIQEADKSGAPLVAAHVVRFFPEFALAHSLVTSGKVGNVASVRMRRGGGAPRSDWFFDIDKSGGILLDLAVHEFDWLLWTLGPANLVTSRTVQTSDKSGIAIRGDYALTTLTFDSGAIAHVESTWMDPSGSRVTLEVSGSNGIIEYDSRDNPTLRTHVTQSVSENNYSPNDDPYFKQLCAFVDVAKGNADPAVTAKEGLQAVKVANAAILSAQTGEPVSLSVS